MKVQIIGFKVSNDKVNDSKDPSSHLTCYFKRGILHKLFLHLVGYITESNAVVTNYLKEFC